ncbi:hypothetical protein B0E38_07450 [Streptomyces sp. 111WW2]|nr:hypothetical protein B0E38_07450 [Streptomyces sp. 111WW2]
MGGAGQGVRPVAEAAVRAVPGDSPGRLLALQEHDACAGPREPGGGRESGGPGSHHQDVGLSAGHPCASSNNARTVAPQ